MFFKKSLYEQALRKMDVADMALIKLSVLAFGFLLATLFPQISTVNPLWYFGAFVVFAAKPMMILYRK